MSASDVACQRLTVRRIESVATARRVRHVDQLSEGELERFYDLIASGSTSAIVEDGEFLDGDVIVFTDYYRVELV